MPLCLTTVVSVVTIVALPRTVVPFETVQPCKIADKNNIAPHTAKIITHIATSLIASFGCSLKCCSNSFIFSNRLIEHCKDTTFFLTYKHKCTNYFRLTFLNSWCCVPRETFYFVHRCGSVPRETISRAHTHNKNRAKVCGEMLNFGKVATQQKLCHKVFITVKSALGNVK